MIINLAKCHLFYQSMTLPFFHYVAKMISLYVYACDRNNLQNFIRIRLYLCVPTFIKYVLITRNWSIEIEPQKNNKRCV